MQISPGGDMLAWIVKQDAARPTGEVGVWVSDLRGRNAREIGRIRQIDRLRTKGPMPRELVFPQDLRWTPDGKSLSFLFDGAMYLVAIP
jgi:hypothetical protein